MDHKIYSKCNGQTDYFGKDHGLTTRAFKSDLNNNAWLKKNIHKMSYFVFKFKIPNILYKCI